ncbi:MAG: O-antigen ligase family protein [Lautropia sp.]
MQTVNGLVAYVWLVVIGSNMAQRYSDIIPYQGMVAVVGFVYFGVAYHRQFAKLSCNGLYVLMLVTLALPLILMLISDRNFARGDYTSLIVVMMIFIASSMLASERSNGSVIIASALTIVIISVTTNLYELVVENNVWSIAPGRSAGFYVNPNISAAALIAFTCIFLNWKERKFRLVDYAVILLAFIGVISTFSRSGIMSALLLLTAAMVQNVRRVSITPVAAGLVGVILVGYEFADYFFINFVSTEDAAMRIRSLFERGGIGDFRADRGGALTAGVTLAMKQPIFGWGPGTVLEMRQGPHNMLIAFWVDYGLLGLMIYLVLLTGFLFTSFRGAGRDVAVPKDFTLWFVLFSLASHNLFGDPATMVYFGLALASMYRANEVSMGRTSSA